MTNKVKTFYLLLSFGFLFFQVQSGFSFTPGQDTEKEKPFDNIAVAAVEDCIDSEISRNAGRAPYYLIFDENGDLLKSITNPAHGRGRGGSSAIVVDFLLEESCKTVIAGNFGDKMRDQLKANEIEYHQLEGTVKEVLQTLLKE